MNKTQIKILRSAITLAKKHGYKNVTGQSVADRAKVSKPLVYHYFPTMKILQKNMIEYAIEKDIYNIILQGLVLRDPIAMTIPSWMKQNTFQAIFQTIK